MDNLEPIIGAIGELISEGTLPKNIKNRVENIIDTLREDTEISIRVNKVLSEFADIADDNNLEPYTRALVWNIMSLLEKVVA